MECPQKVRWVAGVKPMLLTFSRTEWPPELNTEVRKAKNLGLPLVSEPQVIQLAIFMKLK